MSTLYELEFYPEESACGMEYVVLPEKVSADQLSRYCARMREHYTHSVRGWGQIENSEWVVRCYLALKLTLAATLQLSSLEFAQNTNLQVTVPYLAYYSALNCCRALVLTLPDQKWNAGELFTATHNKATHVASAALAQVDPALGAEVSQVLGALRAIREVFSYRFPATGLSCLNEVDSLVKATTTDVDRHCRAIIEVAQLNSELLEATVGKHLPQGVGLDMTVLKQAYSLELTGLKIVDNEDWNRIDYLLRKQPRPASLYKMAREGLVEDFFGAWEAEEDAGNDVYEPGLWNILLSPL